MNTVLWILQILLGLMFIMVGGLKKERKRIYREENAEKVREQEKARPILRNSEHNDGPILQRILRRSASIIARIDKIILRKLNLFSRSGTLLTLKKSASSNALIGRPIRISCTPKPTAAVPASKIMADHAQARSSESYELLRTINALTASAA
jgi:hypothetical protein